MRKTAWLLTVVCGLVAFFMAAPVASAASRRQESNAYARLQLAAGDLVRETTFLDPAGSPRAERAFAAAYAGQRAIIAKKDAKAATAIAKDALAAAEAIKSGDLRRASVWATKLLKALNQAAPKVTGIPAGSTRGALFDLLQLKRAARDLDQEILAKDTQHIALAVKALDKLFKADKKTLTTKDASDTRKIAAVLATIATASKHHQTSRLARLSRSLARAVQAETTHLHAGRHTG